MIGAELIHFGEANHAKRVIADVDSGRCLDRTRFESSGGSSVGGDIDDAIKNQEARENVRGPILQLERDFRPNGAACNLPREC